MTEETANSEPKWQETDSETFVEYGSYFIPDREVQTDIICSLIPPASGEARMLDLCCGEGVLTYALLERFPDSRVLGYDGSETMLDTARAALSIFAERFETRQFDLADTSWRDFPRPLHAVVSSLAIHHLDDEQKQQLFRDVFAMLEPGGAFVVADIIQPTSGQAVALAARMWDETVRQRSLHLSGDLSAYEEFHALGWNSFAATEPDPLDKMSSLFDQLKWLEQAGFDGVDVFWAKAGHAVFGGYKPPAVQKL
ncbi:MAG: class I SAM-dependent methyltransferase [Chloroflexota bacterium]|nr:class I SAM-dependent methyltransferase [Chloroflexota bacterium]